MGKNTNKDLLNNQGLFDRLWLGEPHKKKSKETPQQQQESSWGDSWGETAHETAQDCIYSWETAKDSSWETAREEISERVSKETSTSKKSKSSSGDLDVNEMDFNPAWRVSDGEKRLSISDLDV